MRNQILDRDDVPARLGKPLRDLPLAAAAAPQKPVSGREAVDRIAEHREPQVFAEERRVKYPAIERRPMSGPPAIERGGDGGPGILGHMHEKYAAAAHARKRIVPQAPQHRPANRRAPGKLLLEIVPVMNAVSRIYERTEGLWNKCSQSHRACLRSSCHGLSAGGPVRPAIARWSRKKISDKTKNGLSYLSYAPVIAIIPVPPATNEQLSRNRALTRVRQYWYCVRAGCFSAHRELRRQAAPPRRPPCALPENSRQIRKAACDTRRH